MALNKAKYNGLCKYFNGHCRNGVHCKYIHVKLPAHMHQSLQRDPWSVTLEMALEWSEENKANSKSQNKFCTPITGRASRIANMIIPKSLVKNLSNISEDNSSCGGEASESSQTKLSPGQLSSSTPHTPIDRFTNIFSNPNLTSTNLHQNQKYSFDSSKHIFQQDPTLCGSKEKTEFPKFNFEKDITVTNQKWRCKCPALYVIILILSLFIITILILPLFSWNAKFLEIAEDLQNEIVSLYNLSKSGLVFTFMNVANTTTDIVANTAYGVQGMKNTVIMMFEQSGRFAFVVNDEIDSFFHDVVITSMKDTWITRVSEGIPLDTGLEYVDSKRNQKDRYPKQFVDDLQHVILDLLNANIKDDFIEYREVGFQNNKLTGHVGVIAIRRYSYKREFDIAYSITSTDVNLEYKHCTKKYFGLGNCMVDITDRKIRSKLAKYFQKELILDLKSSYPGKIDVIVQSSAEIENDAYQTQKKYWRNEL